MIVCMKVLYFGTEASAPIRFKAVDGDVKIGHQLLPLPPSFATPFGNILCTWLQEKDGSVWTYSVILTCAAVLDLVFTVTVYFYDPSSVHIFRIGAHLFGLVAVYDVSSSSLSTYSVFLALLFLTSGIRQQSFASTLLYILDLVAFCFARLLLFSSTLIWLCPPPEEFQ